MAFGIPKAMPGIRGFWTRGPEVWSVDGHFGHCGLFMQPPANHGPIVHQNRATRTCRRQSRLSDSSQSEVSRTLRLYPQTQDASFNALLASLATGPSRPIFIVPSFMSNLQPLRAPNRNRSPVPLALPGTSTAKAFLGTQHTWGRCG